MDLAELKNGNWIGRVKGLLRWSFPIRLLLSALITILGSHGLGVLSDYATYKYAYQFGVRVPFEGVPYLNASVTMGSIGLLIWGAIIFVGVNLLLRALIVQAIWSKRIQGWLRRKFGPDAFINRDVIKGNIDELSFRWRLISVIVGSLILTLLYLGSLWISEEGFAWGDLIGDKWKRLLMIPYFPIALSAVLIPSTTWISALFIVIAYFVTAIVFMMTPVKYAKFLQETGYGGEIPIELKVNDVTLQKDLQSSAVTFLIIKTNDTFIVRNIENTVLEVPRSAVTYWRYQRRIGNRVPWFLL